jgi:hypothetical protein
MQHPENERRKRAKPFQTKKRPGKGSKAEAAQATKEKYGHLKGGVWEPDEEERLRQELSAGQKDIFRLGEIFNRSHRVIRRKLKRIGTSLAEETDVKVAADYTGLDEEGLKKMVANKVRREKKKAEKAKNKTLPPRDPVIELLTAIHTTLLALADHVGAVRDPQGGPPLGSRPNPSNLH